MLSDVRNGLAGAKVLIVDDSPQVADLLGDVFRECGARVATVHSGKAATIPLTVGQFDLVLLDLCMPKPDGWDLLRLLRRARPDVLTRTIVITGDQFSRRGTRLLARARLPVVYKPFDIEQIRALARRTLLAAPPAPRGTRWRSDVGSSARCE